MYDKNNKEWVETYFIDGEEKDSDTYFSEMENETVIASEDEDCECLDCLTDKYVDMLQESCCTECTRKILINYLGEIFHRIEFDKE